MYLHFTHSAFINIWRSITNGNMTDFFPSRHVTREGRRAWQLMCRNQSSTQSRHERKEMEMTLCSRYLYPSHREMEMTLCSRYLYPSHREMEMTLCSRYLYPSHRTSYEMHSVVAC